MNRYRITLGSPGNKRIHDVEANNILHLLSRVSESFNINRITKIELLSNEIK